MTSDLPKGLVDLWTNSGLDLLFKAYWTGNNGNEFFSLHDHEAEAAQPFPYCVFEIGAGATKGRMTKGVASGRMETRSIPVDFNIHTRSIGATTAKRIAATLAEEVIKVFGGHPVDLPQQVGLENGNVLQVQYQTDFPTREGNQEYMWTVRYMFLIDIPVAA